MTFPGFFGPSRWRLPQPHFFILPRVSYEGVPPVFLRDAAGCDETHQVLAHHLPLAQLEKVAGLALPAVDDPLLHDLVEAQGRLEGVQQFLLAPGDHVDVGLAKLLEPFLDDPKLVARDPGAGGDREQAFHGLDRLIDAGAEIPVPGAEGGKVVIGQEEDSLVGEVKADVADRVAGRVDDLGPGPAELEDLAVFQRPGGGALAPVEFPDQELVPFLPVRALRNPVVFQEGPVRPVAGGLGLVDPQGRIGEEMVEGRVVLVVVRVEQHVDAPA